MQTLNSLTTVNLDRQFDSTNLERTVSYYEAVIDRGDENSHNYWNLGLAYLLQEREIDAQATWFIPFDRASEAETSALTDELATILDRVICQKILTAEFNDAWLIFGRLCHSKSM
jgi:hypothetical protein